MRDAFANRIHCKTIETLNGWSVVTTVNDVQVGEPIRYLMRDQVDAYVQSQHALFEELQRQIRQKLEAAQPMDAP